MTNTPATLEGPATPAKDESDFLKQGFTHTIALIIDGVVQDIMATQPRAASILLSNPTIIETTHLPEVKPGYIYNEITNSFSRPTTISLAELNRG